MKLESEIDVLQAEKSQIEELLEQQQKQVHAKFDATLEARFWFERDENMVRMLIRFTQPAICMFFLFMCVSLSLNYFSAEAQYRGHDIRQSLVSFSATWLTLLVLFILVRRQQYRHLFKPVMAVMICFALTVNLCMQMTMLSLPLIWRGTIVMALGTIFVYLCVGIRPRLAFYSSMSASFLTLIYMFFVHATVPFSIMMNTLLLPNLVGLALAVLAISTERLRFLMSIIIDYDKQIYALLHQHFIHLSHQDTLTLLGNRRGFEKNLQNSMQHTRRTRQAFAILFIDVDFFKFYNDFYGHDQGDKALIQVAETLLRHIHDNDVAIRFGGEEFIVLLKNSSLLLAQQKANAILADMRQQKIPHKASNISEYLTVSIGLSLYQGECNITYSDVLKSADQALYHAKMQGRDQCQYLDLCQEGYKTTAP